MVRRDVGVFLLAALGGTSCYLLHWEQHCFRGLIVDTGLPIWCAHEELLLHVWWQPWFTTRIHGATSRYQGATSKLAALWCATG